MSMLQHTAKVIKVMSMSYKLSPGCGLCISIPIRQVSNALLLLSTIQGCAHSSNVNTTHFMIYIHRKKCHSIPLYTDD